jgi:flotillin
MLTKFARLLTTDKKNMEELILGIVEGETRLIAASLTMEEIFKDRKLFKETVIENIAAELAQFGNDNFKKA